MTNQKGNAKSNSFIQYPACLQLEQTTRFECIIPDQFGACLGCVPQTQQSVLPVKFSFIIFNCPLFFGGRGWGLSFGRSKLIYIRE
jgi:hypothetical protein